MKKYILYISLLAVLFASCDKASDSGPVNTADPTAAGNTTGQGGSLARFTIADDRLYVVDDQKLYTYSLINEDNPQLKSSQSIGFNVETIYAYKDKLFIGSQQAMYIYSISNADYPSKLGEARHVRACDPVVANDSIAYVTVRSGTNCGGTVNAMYVYNINYILQPRQRNVIPMKNPHGLGMKGDRLYVCDGSNGLSIYNITDPIYPKLVKQVYGDTFYDVIIYDNLLICMIEGGMLLYEIKPNDELVRLANITG